MGSEKNQQQLAELEMALKNTWESKAKISKEYEQERNRLLQEQQAAAQQLKAAKERNWSLLEEKGQCELTISHVKEICKAANATTMEDHIDALQRQVLALETHEKKAQDQQSVCAVFRVALEKDIQALLQVQNQPPALPCSALSYLRVLTVRRSSGLVCRTRVSSL